MTLVTFILWCIAIYLGITVVLPLVVFLLSSLLIGILAVIEAAQEKKK